LSREGCEAGDGKIKFCNPVDLISQLGFLRKSKGNGRALPFLIFHKNPFLSVQSKTNETSQLRSGWKFARKLPRPEGTLENVRLIPSSLAGRFILLCPAPATS